MRFDTCDRAGTFKTAGLLAPLFFGQHCDSIEGL